MTTRISLATCSIVKWHTKLMQNTRSSTTNCTQSFTTPTSCYRSSVTSWSTGSTCKSPSWSSQRCWRSDRRYLWWQGSWVLTTKLTTGRSSSQWSVDLYTFTILKLIIKKKYYISLYYKSSIKNIHFFFIWKHNNACANNESSVNLTLLFVNLPLSMLNLEIL